MSSNLFSKLYIQTRGKTIDYRFLLQAPQEPWWTSYEKDTSFEYPTLIIERDSRGGRGRFYLSGISSSTRRDRVGRIIRYTLVAEFPRSEKRLLHLAQFFLDELSEQGSTPTLSEIFDDCFPREYVERALVSDNIDIDSENKELTKKFEELLSEVKKKPNQGSSGVPLETNIWWGGLKNDESRSRWMSLAESILQQGESGKALLLNLASRQSLRDLAPNVKTALLLPESSEEPQPFTPGAGKINSSLVATTIIFLILLTILFFVLQMIIFNNPSIESFWTLIKMCLINHCH